MLQRRRLVDLDTGNTGVLEFGNHNLGCDFDLFRGVITTMIYKVVET